MEPTDEARRWISELVGAAVDDHLSRAPQGWASLGPALAAIHGVAMPAETEPAVQIHIPIPKSQ